MYLIKYRYRSRMLESHWQISDCFLPTVYNVRTSRINHNSNNRVGSVTYVDHTLLPKLSDDENFQGRLLAPFGRRSTQCTPLSTEAKTPFSPCINYVQSRRGYAFPVRMCIPGEVHSVPGDNVHSQ